MRKHFFTTLQLVFIIIIFSALYSFSMFQGGFVSWFLLFSFLPIGLYHILLLFYPLKRLKVSRNLSNNVSEAGESIEVTIHLKRRIPFPIYFLVCEEVIPSSLQTFYKDLGDRGNNPKKRTVKRILFPWFKRNIKMNYTLHHLPRGKHDFSGVRVWTGDVFGFIHKETTFFTSAECTVHPKTYPVTFLNPLLQIGEGNQHTTSFKRANSSLATGVRKYVPGDKVGWINWKQTARMNKVMTKEFDHESTNNSTFILDRCSGEEQDAAAFEAAVSLFYSLLNTRHEQTDDSYFITIGEEIVRSHRNDSKQEQAVFQTHLLTLQQQDGCVFANKLKRALTQTQNKAHTVFIIVTSIGERLVEALLRINQQIGEIRVLFIQAERERNESSTGRISILNKNKVTVTVLSEKAFSGENVEVKLA